MIGLPVPVLLSGLPDELSEEEAEAIIADARSRVKKPFIFAAVLDASGSMHKLISDTLGGYNAMIDEQKKNPDAAIHYLTTFDTRFQHRIEGANLQTVPPLTHERYFEGHGGYTALRDTVGSAIQALRKTHTGRQRGVMLIITDGEDNASTQFSNEEVKSAIKDAESDGWEFVFIGADTTKWREVGAAMGATVTASYTASPTGTRAAYNSVSANIGSMRTMGVSAQSRSWSTSDSSGPV